MEERQMNESRNRWLLGAAALVLAVTMAAIAYNVGVSQGAQMAASVSANAGATGGAQPGTLPPYPYAYGWHRPWGFGVVPFLFLIFFWIILFRALAGGGPPWRRWHYYGGPHDRETFDEWHRRAHDQMKG
jgi:hypothetical protein